MSASPMPRERAELRAGRAVRLAVALWLLAAAAGAEEVRTRRLPWFSAPPPPAQAGPEPALPEHRTETCIHAALPQPPSSHVFLLAGATGTDVPEPGALVRRVSPDSGLRAVRGHIRNAARPRAPPAARPD